MGQKNLPKKTQYETVIQKALIFSSAAVILAMVTNLRDPINTIKYLILVILAAWLSGHILFSFPKSIYSEQPLKTWLYLSTIFILFLTVSTVSSDNLLTSFIGQPGRLNGLLNYVSLILISIAAAVVTNIKAVLRIIDLAIILGVTLSSYGIMQSLGKDFVKWNNPYNSVITTAGNPNFSAAIMAILAIITFGAIFNNQISTIKRFVSLAVTPLLIYTIYLTDARQGLLTAVVGFGIVTSVYLYNQSKYIGRLFMLFASAVSGMAILGILQIGPLSFLYKSSVTVRGYYIKAGIEMFKSHPFLGVGLDRYGAYFKEYRDLEYPLKYGFAISSNNAHNVPIQFFSTAGIFSGLAYVAIIIFIIRTSLIAIKITSGSHRLLITTIFSAWVAYQAQSFVSIDSPGASLLGWQLSGMLIGLSSRSKDNTITESQRIGPEKKVSVPIKQPLFSGSLVLIALIFSSLILKGESLVYKSGTFYSPEYLENTQNLKKAANSIFNLPLMNNDYKVEVAAKLIDLGLVSEGVSELEEITDTDPRNEIAQEILATTYYSNGDIKNAILRRENIASINPWDARNYLILGQLYKATGDFNKMMDAKSFIAKYFPGTKEANQAEIQLNS